MVKCNHADTCKTACRHSVFHESAPIATNDGFIYCTDEEECAECGELVRCEGEA